ncbi:unnamed protein product [Prorocentrum cordatum]|uniref:Uncharacterized protein n=1 Tax=Prorocentrum cordatum TaxID=2364126 RepID=A0ABN9TVV4_9DINO|nr:unnamed protein product [Polarella glacialis]
MADGVPEELGEVLSNATATFGGKVAELVRQTANATVELNLTSIAAAPPGRETPVVVVQLSKVKLLAWLTVALAVVGSVAAAVAMLLRGPGSGDGELRRRVEGLRVTRGAELRSMFGASSGGPPADQALSPGILMRIRGRVVAGAEGPLQAPFSQRACVTCSACVSRGRHDGIQPPPLAFHAAGRDFEVQLSDAPRLSVAVRGHDVALFSMAGGLEVHEVPFAGAPESWRRFVLDRLVPVAGPAAHFDSCEDLGSAGGPLQFRECALAVGAEATLVGEVAREAGGALRLRPWRPPSSPERRAAADPLCGHVMASDCPSLLGGAPAALPLAPGLLQRWALRAPQAPWPWPALRRLLGAGARPKRPGPGNFPVPG